MLVINDRKLHLIPQFDNVRITLDRKFNPYLSFYRLYDDNWLRREFDNLGLLIRSIKISGQENFKLSKHDDRVYPIQITLLDCNKDYDDKEYKKEYGFIFAENLEQAQKAIDFINSNINVYYP